ncbi:MAG TPA: efflux RND transporter periplasmic adaptor subunit, partial [Verrucomicrobiae bacterium]|nr:efflux RND transporter periplasmic adaptor subunit [Verrucomicrobiae bacterium]
MVWAVIAGVFLGGCSKWNEPPRRDVVSGTIETDETRVASRYGGRVQDILAWEGDSLNPGQVIIRLDAEELRARRAQAAALLDEWKAGPRKQELESAKNDWQALIAQLEFARTDAVRVEKLFQQKTGAVSAADRDHAVMEAQSLERNVAAAKSRYDLLVAGTRPEKLAQGEAQVRELDAQLREMEITAPTNAVLEVLSVRWGDVVAPNQQMATLVLKNHLWVRVYIPEPWLGHIKLGQQVRVTVDSFPNKEFKGEVEQIARAAEFTPRNVQT